MVKRPPTACPQCATRQQQIQDLCAQVERLEQANRQLQEQLAKAQKNSSTSSKPPSSDIVKPPKPPDPQQGKRKIGAQPGHTPHWRVPFPPEQVTQTISYQLPHCPDCGHDLELLKEPPRIIQQIDLAEINCTIEEHHCHSSWCPRCRKVYQAPAPAHVEAGGLFGPRLTALVGYLKGACHASFATIRKFFRDVMKITVSRGYLRNVINKVSVALQRPYDELLGQLPEQDYLHVDETGHKLNGERWWTWCFRAELFALYHIDPHRNAEVLMKALGKDFQGVLGCDYLSTYRRFMRECHIQIQFCLAHLIRDLKFLTKLPRAEERVYGERLRDLVRELFAIIHQREHLSGTVFKHRLQAKQAEIIAAGLQEVSGSKHCRAMANRFRKHGEAYFTFITTPGIEPTNNLAEQAIRFVVIDRHITQGTRSESGNRWSERIWTVIATCALQGKSVSDFLYDSIIACWTETDPPHLVGE